MMAAMVGITSEWGLHTSLRLILQPYQVVAIALGVLFATPIVPVLNAWVDSMLSGRRKMRPAFGRLVELTVMSVLLLQFTWCACLVVSGTYNPFIYFRF